MKRYLFRYDLNSGVGTMGVQWVHTIIQILYMYIMVICLQHTQFLYKNIFLINCVHFYFSIRIVK